MKFLKLTIIFLIFLSFGCATSAGNLFKTIVKDSSLPHTTKHSESNTGTGNWTDTTDTSSEQQGLTIITTPTGSNVYLNNDFVGTSPVTLNPETGRYKLTVEKKGYYRETQWIDFSQNETREIDFTLKRLTGYLYIDTTPRDVTLRANGIPLQEGVNELPVGTYHIDAEYFGYESYNTDILITKRATTKIFIKLKPAVFNFSGLTPSRKVFNPDNPAGLGQSAIKFTVSTYGTGNLSILSQSKRVVLSHSFPLFTDWNQKFTWNGKNNFGKPLGNGTYTVVLTGENRDGTITDTKSTVITIDRSIIIKVRSLFSGASGTLYAPTPDTLPMGNFQFDLSSLGHNDSYGYLFPTSASLRFSPLPQFETDLSGGIIIQSPTDNTYFFSLSGKKELIRTKTTAPFNLSTVVKGTYLLGTNSDTMTNFTGLSVSFPAGITLGPVSLIVTPDIIFSPFRISYTSEASPAGFNLWGYGRSAIILDLGPIWTAFSGSVRSAPFSEGFTVDYPLSAGWEVHWILPDTGIILSGYLSGEFNPVNGLYLNAGGGVGFIN